MAGAPSLVPLVAAPGAISSSSSSSSGTLVTLGVNLRCWNATAARWSERWSSARRSGERGTVTLVECLLLAVATDGAEKATSAASAETKKRVSDLIFQERNDMSIAKSSRGDVERKLKRKLQLGGGDARLRRGQAC